MKSSRCLPPLTNQPLTAPPHASVPSLPSVCWRLPAKVLALPSKTNSQITRSLLNRPNHTQSITPFPTFSGSVHQPIRFSGRLSSDIEADPSFCCLDTPRASRCPPLVAGTSHLPGMEASLPASHNSPGPTDMASHGASTDKNSKKSTTLQNALPPFPDTQRDSPGHDLSSPTERDGGVQLLSRPQDVDIDPGESFSWGKPVKIIPGQFSRPVPTKPMVDAIKEKAPATSPEVIGRPISKAPDAIASGSVQAHPLAPGQCVSVISPNSRRLPAEQSSHTILSSVEGRPNSKENTKPVANDTAHSTRVQGSARRPPFEDYQPQYQRPDGRPEAPVAQPSPAHRPTHPEALGMIETQHLGAIEVKDQVSRQGKTFSEQGRRSHHSKQHPQQDQSKNSVQENGPGHRLSLPNDTSVSPGQIPQHLPKETSQHQAMRESLVPQNSLAKSPSHNLNRPMKDVRRLFKTKTPPHPPSSRSSMQRSNIRKKRSRRCPSASGTTCRTHQQESNHRDESPSTRRRGLRIRESHRSPPLEDIQESSGAPAIDMVAENVAQSLNSNFGMIRTDWMRMEQEIFYLEGKMRDQQQRLSNFERQSEGKSGRIQELEEDRVRLQEQLESANQRLEDRCTKLSELQKKCRTYKEHLNSATEEQQDLYKAAKAKCETAIKQMREEEHKRKVLDEQQRKDLQATRERLTQVVKSTVAEYSSKERECKLWSCRRIFCHKLMNSSQQQTRGVESENPRARG